MRRLVALVGFPGFFLRVLTERRKLVVVVVVPAAVLAWAVICWPGIL